MWPLMIKGHPGRPLTHPGSHVRIVHEDCERVWTSLREERFDPVGFYEALCCDAGYKNTQRRSLCDWNWNQNYLQWYRT